MNPSSSAKTVTTVNRTFIDCLYLLLVSYRFPRNSRDDFGTTCPGLVEPPPFLLLYPWFIPSSGVDGIADALFRPCCPVCYLVIFQTHLCRTNTIKIIARSIIFTSPHRSYMYLPGRHLRRLIRPPCKHNSGAGNDIMTSVVPGDKLPRKFNSLVRCPLLDPHYICNFHDSPVSVI